MDLRLIPIFFTILLYAPLTVAQSSIDSLKNLLNSTAHDTLQAKWLGDLAWEYSFTDLALAEDYAWESLAISQSSGYEKGEGDAYNLLGNIWRDKGSFDSAITFHQQANNIFEKLAIKEKLAITSSLIGNVLKGTGRYAAALKYYQESQKMYAKLQDSVQIHAIDNNLGLVHLKVGNYTRALELFLHALTYFDTKNNLRMMSILYTNIGIVHQRIDNLDQALYYYHRSYEIDNELNDRKNMAVDLINMANVQQEKGNYKKALEQVEEAAAINEALNLHYRLANNYLTTGNIKEEQGDYTGALDEYQKSFSIKEGTGDIAGLSLVYQNLGSVYFHLQEYALSIENNLISLEMAQSIKNKTLIERASAGLAQGYKRTGELKKAFEYLELYSIYRDSIIDQDKTRQLQELETIYHTEKQASEIELLNKNNELAELELDRQRVRQRNSRNAFLAGSLLLLLLGGFVYSRYRLKRKANLQLEEKNKIIAEEKHKSDNLLLNILPYETAEELKQNGAAKARRYEQVSVLFADIKGFTTIAAAMTPEQLVDQLHQFFQAFDAIMEKHHIEKIKTIGDAYMCAGGLPMPNENHAMETVKAALEMQEVLQQFRKQDGAPEFQARIGVHSGPVVAGVVGSKKFAYDIWGDTVNTASRMEQCGEAGRVNISADTFELIRNNNQFRFEGRGKIEAKGKGMIEMYYVDIQKEKFAVQ